MQAKNYTFEPATPWIIPELPKKLTQIIFTYGHNAFYKKNSTILQEDQVIDQLFFIQQGLLSQAVINNALNKPLAMNLFTTGRVVGCLNLFTGSFVPRRILSLQDSQLVCISHQQFLSELEKDFSLYQLMVSYCEIANQSELNGMIALFTMSVEDRLKLLFVVALISSGYQFDVEKNEWARLPFILRRKDILRVIYASQITLDRLLAKWGKEEIIKKYKGALYIKTGYLYPVYKWTLSL